MRIIGEEDIIRSLKQERGEERTEQIERRNVRFSPETKRPDVNGIIRHVRNNNLRLSEIHSKIETIRSLPSRRKRRAVLFHIADFNQVFCNLHRVERSTLTDLVADEPKG